MKGRRASKRKRTALGEGKDAKKQSLIMNFFSSEDVESIRASKRVEHAAITSPKAVSTSGARAKVLESAVTRKYISDIDSDDVLKDVFGTDVSFSFHNSENSSSSLRQDLSSDELDDDFLDQAIFATKQKKGPTSISSRRKKKPKARLKYTLDTLLAEPKEQFNGTDPDFDELKNPVKEEKQVREEHNNSMDELKLGDKYGRDKVPIVVFTRRHVCWNAYACSNISPFLYSRYLFPSTPFRAILLISWNAFFLKEI